MLEINPHTEDKLLYPLNGFSIKTIKPLQNYEIIYEH